MPAAAVDSPPPVITGPISEPSYWPLDTSYDFLNHGSFGSVPKPIEAAQRRYRDLIEAKPIEMLGRRCRELLVAPRQSVAKLLGADPDGLGFVTNATEGINAVLRSLDLRPGDVLLTTNHVYYAVRQAMRLIARRAGAEVRVVDVPLPIARPSDVTERIAKAIDARTRLVVVDHVTSPTAIVFPIAEIAQMCQERSVDCLVDGAHAPGMLEVNVRAMGATYFTGNLHKWVCAPKGCGVLWVNEERRRDVQPVIVSHFLDEGFDVEFDWQGTRDISPWLAATDAIALWESVGWDRMRAHNQGLSRWVQRFLCERFDVAPLTPLTEWTNAAGAGTEADAMIGSMVTVPLPNGIETRFPSVEACQAALYEHHRIEIPIIAWENRWHCRASCQTYNRPEQYRRLADAVLSLCA
ncbi:MAG: aminotransferase class V-fold PLP-dependent enzyme [Phycisphaerae bacterium]|nr:aminotransferase class V-fold PLP-dependent enzyme [Phycisphaerae bacterium]